jgi:hypothetical protein
MIKIPLVESDVHAPSAEPPHEGRLRSLQATDSEASLHEPADASDGGRSAGGTMSNATQGLRVVGPGGPYEAMVECAEAFSRSRNVTVEVIKGPWSAGSIGVLI